MIIIGITGTLGAGKGTIVDYLIKKFGFIHYSVRDYLIKEAKKQQLALNRDTYVFIANKLRAEHSPSFIIDELYKEALSKGENAIIESIRTVGEVTSLKSKANFLLLAVDADTQRRYQRVISRQSETDHISYDVFIENELREMNSDNPNNQNLAACISLADYHLQNNSDYPDLYAQVDAIMSQVDNNKK